MRSGVALLILAMCLTPGVDALAKMLTAEHSPFLVAFFRYFAGGVVALCVAKTSGARLHIPKDARGGQLLRTALLVSSMTCLITAFSLVPLAYAVGGFLIAPIVAVTISVVFFNERLTIVRAFGVALSAIGALLISQPAAGFEFGTLLALAGGVLLGTYLSFTRASRNTGGALSTLAIQCFLGSVMIAPLAFWNGLPNLSPSLVIWVSALGIFSAGAHFLTVAAYERADAAVLSPFMYFNLVAAVIVGYLWFGEVPSMTVSIGLFAIAFGGLVTLLPAMREALQSQIRPPSKA